CHCSDRAHRSRSLSGSVAATSAETGERVDRAGSAGRGTPRSDGERGALRSDGERDDPERGGSSDSDSHSTRGGCSVSSSGGTAPFSDSKAPAVHNDDPKGSSDDVGSAGAETHPTPDEHDGDTEARGRRAQFHLGPVGEAVDLEGSGPPQSRLCELFT